MGCILGVCPGPPRDVNSLVERLKLLGGLRVFWAKAGKGDHRALRGAAYPSALCGARGGPGNAAPSSWPAIGDREPRRPSTGSSRRMGKPAVHHHEGAERRVLRPKERSVPLRRP